MNDYYNGFHYYYDIYMEEMDIPSWFSYLKSLSGISSFHSKSILDLGCGTGKMAIYFAKEKAKVTAVDISKQMLKIADKNAYDNKVRLNLIGLDMTKFKTSANFDFVYSACDSLNYLTKEEDLKTVFKNIYSMLKDNSIFTFDYIPFEGMGLIEKKEVYKSDIYEFLSYRETENNFLKTKVVIKENKEILYEKEHIQMCLNNKRIFQLAKGVGFREIIAYDFLTTNNPTKETDKIQYIFKK